MDNNKPNQTYQAIPSADELTAAFIKREKKSQRISDGGGNSYLNSLEVVAKILIANSDNGQSFSINDMRHLSISLEIPLDAIQDFWGKWTTALCEGKRLKKMVSIYDYDLFQVV